MDIVVDGGLVTAAVVILSFVINQALVWAGVSVSTLAKKLVVFAVSIGLVGYSAYQGGLSLPVSGDPIALGTALLAYATAVFKVSQPVYDRLWQGLLAAK